MMHSQFFLYNLSLLLALFFSVAPESLAYYGAHSTEATLQFQARADLAYNGRPMLAALNDPKSNVRKKMLELLDEQIQHLMGAFIAPSYLKKYPFPGSLGEAESYTIHFTKLEPGSEVGRFQVSYEFRGRVVFRKEIFHNTPLRKDVPIVLPLAPDRIYEISYNDKKEENFCTDEHYNTKGDFLYFWDPEQENCPLAGNDTDLVRTFGKLTEISNTKNTYPEYDLLYGKGDPENPKTLDIAIFFGYINDLTNVRWPRRSDEARNAFNKMDEYFLDKEQGYVRTFKHGPFREDSLGREIDRPYGINYIRIYEKDLMIAGRTTHVRVQMLLADTMIDSRDSTFHNYWVKAVKDSDIIYYDGHSGLGGNLDLGRMPDIALDPNKYQIIFFNGCSSYPYFNAMYVNAKGGTKYLDIVSSALPTMADTVVPNAVAFLDNFVHGRKISWQRLLGRVDRSNGDNGTYLVGVSGDEDNVWRPAL